MVLAWSSSCEDGLGRVVGRVGGGCGEVQGGSGNVE